MSAGNGAHGWAVWNTTVWASGVSILVMIESMNENGASLAWFCSMENFTSAEVTGLPLVNFASLRRWKVQLSLSADWVHDVASDGCTSLPSCAGTVRVS